VAKKARDREFVFLLYRR